MGSNAPTFRFVLRRGVDHLWSLCLVAGLFSVGACAPSLTTSGAASSAPSTIRATTSAMAGAAAPNPDPRIGLSAGLMNAGEAIWNLHLLSKTPPPQEFIGVTNSDLAFTGNYAIQGNYSGFLVWDISNPAQPSLVRGYLCPASQSDVSVFKNLLFISGEGYGGRLDCGTEGVQDAISGERLRGIRIFDITDIRNPRYVGNVQTCRGSHTHSLLVDPEDTANIYIYVSGSAPVRPAEELPGCSEAPLGEDPRSALFRIEVIRVPLAQPELAAIISSPRIFTDLVAPPKHGLAPEDLAEVDRARARGAFVVDIEGEPYILSNGEANQLLGQVVGARGGSGAPTPTDSLTLRQVLPQIVADMVADQPVGPAPGPTQCHDITVYPEIGLAGGACEGYGFLIDIRDPANPRRVAEASDSNFSYWHSATFNNDGTKILFSDEWGGGGQAKCRPNDPHEWGADAIFTIENAEMRFRSYYKLPVPQTTQENCVAHNGSLIPIPGRDVMVQSWYQGGISVFDWTDADSPVEIAFFDRGPVDSTRQRSGGSWSAYWYNGVIVSSEISRGLDVLELAPSALISQNEIDAARSVLFDHFDVQGQQRFVWPVSFALARSYVDQLERSNGLSSDRISSVRRELTAAESATAAARRDALTTLGGQLEGEATRAPDAAKVRMLAGAVQELAAGP